MPCFQVKGSAFYALLKGLSSSESFMRMGIELHPEKIVLGLNSHLSKQQSKPHSSCKGCIISSLKMAVIFSLISACRSSNL